MRKIINIIRSLIWRVLGIDYQKMRGTLAMVRADSLIDRTDWVRMGAHSFSNGARAERFAENEALTIGKYCSIAWDVFFLTGAGIHNHHNVSTFPFIDHLHAEEDVITLNKESLTVREWNERMAYTSGPITVGNDVWISMRAIIQSGVTIGDGAVILANAVVTKDVPPYAIAGGVPAKVVRYRFAPEIIQQLLNIAWWDWPEETIRTREADFYLPVEEFIKKYKTT